MTVVDLGEDGAVAIEERELPVRRRSGSRGSFDELMERPDAAEHEEAYVEVTLTDGEPVLDPMERLRAVYP